MKHRVGHRGAPREFPANTLRGFARAMAWGCSMVECDVRRASDGVLVLAHDPVVMDAAGSRYEIARQASEELQRLDLGAGEGVATLEQLVAWASSSGVAVMADMKCEGEGVEEAVCAALALLPVSAKIVPGAGIESRARFRRADPLLPLSLTLNRTAEAHLRGTGFENWLAGWETQTLRAVTWQYPLLTPERIRALKNAGLTVYAWTVDDVDTMRRLRDAGVDGIISNRPELLADL